MTIAIFGNAMKANIYDELDHILEFLQLRGVDILLSQELRQEFNLREYAPFPTEWLQEDGGWKTLNGEAIDFAISLGGDGTFLTTASMIEDKDIPIIGINCGRLGFLADVQTKEIDLILENLVKNQYTIEQRTLLNVVPSKDCYLASQNALNEVAVMKQSLSSMITIEASVNGELLNIYEADGLVVATPTGSTAYNLSVGGPIMMPQSRGIILSPIATHSLNVRPLVVPDDWKIDLKIRSRNGNYMVSVDGRSQIISDSINLHIERAKYTIKLVQIGKHSFIQSLRDKLFWGNR